MICFPSFSAATRRLIAPRLGSTFPPPTPRLRGEAMMMKVLLERPKLFLFALEEKKFNQVIFEIDLLVQWRTNLEPEMIRKLPSYADG
jgi:hypothetical protein